MTTRTACSRRLLALKYCSKPWRLPLGAQYSTNSPSPPTPSWTPPRQYSTPLAKQLAEAIKTTGPIPLAVYMRQCLTSESGGYYTAQKGDRDPFGRKGDFVTSPEISQMFGEMIGVWIRSEWELQGSRKGGMHLIELGPGRGTLMDDVLRTLQSWPTLTSAISSIHLIEASPHLRLAQKNLLCGESTPFTENSDGTHTATSKYASIQIIWHDALSSVPKDKTTAPFILAHEFFDALPIHAFEATASGWREFLVGPTDANASHSSLSTPKSQVLGSKVPEFALTLAKAPTPHSAFLTKLSPRYQALSTKPGSVIEISPDSLVIIRDIAQRIGSSKSGAALIIDYGPGETIPTNSLRGIKDHRNVLPFTEPGEVDLSVDVDFTGLAENALVASERVEVHGPVEQGDYLKAMGMEKRMESLLKGVEDEKKRKVVESAFRRLTEKGIGAMGKVYKALAVVPERGGKRPVGFGQ